MSHRKMLDILFRTQYAFVQYVVWQYVNNFAACANLAWLVKCLSTSRPRNSYEYLDTVFWIPIKIVRIFARVAFAIYSLGEFVHLLYRNMIPMSSSTSEIREDRNWGMIRIGKDHIILRSQISGRLLCESLGWCASDHALHKMKLAYGMLSTGALWNKLPPQKWWMPVIQSELYSHIMFLRAS